MGQESSDRSMMSRMCQSLSTWLALTLDEPEREAVLGDLAQSGEGGWKGVTDILGLVIRRQAGAWKDFHLWLALGALVVPLTFLLSTGSQGVIGGGAIDTWLYVNNWDWELAKSAGFWYVLRDVASQLGTSCILLACWSGSAGFVLGRLPKQLARTCQMALLALLALSQASVVASLSDLNAPVIANMFYRVFFPWIVVIHLIALPALMVPGTDSGLNYGIASLGLFS